MNIIDFNLGEITIARHYDICHISLSTPSVKFDETGFTFISTDRSKMEISLIHNESCSAYPGQYVPLPDIETSKIDRMNTITEPLVNMDEFDDCFEIEVAIPGIRKEDIIIDLHDNTVSITVFHVDGKSVGKRTRIHEFDINYFERHIPLPGNADTQLISAEYREGILNLFIPKAEEPAKPDPHHIAVY